MNTYIHLSLSERYHLHTLVKNAYCIPLIAQRLNRDPTTIRRELRRGGGRKNYDPGSAHQRSQNRRRCGRKSYKMNQTTIDTIQGLIKQNWSPEQIWGRLSLEGKPVVCPVTIYRYIYAQARQGNPLWKHLRSARKKPKPRNKHKTIRQLIAQRIPISQRPPIVDELARLGDLEVDTIVGAYHKGAIVTLVDRKSQHLWNGTASREERR